MIMDATAAFTGAAKMSVTKYVWPLFAREVLTMGE
jgi:hypothetical protein